MRKVIISFIILLLGCIAGFIIFKEICKSNVGMQTKTHVSPVTGCICGKNNFLASHLTLTDKQREKLRNLDNYFDSNIKAICRDLCDKRIKLAELLKANKIYNKEIDKCIDEIVSYQAKIEKETAKHIFDIKNELDKEQQEKFIKLVYDKLCKGLNAEGIQAEQPLDEHVH